MEQYYSPQLFKKQSFELIDQLANYLELCQQRAAIPVPTTLEPDEMYELWQTDFEEIEEQPIEQIFKKVIQHSNKIQHPRFIGHQVSPPLPITALSGLASNMINGSMAIYEMGAVANGMNRVLIEFLVNKIGMGEKAFGTMLSGGSLGNLTALLAARQSEAEGDVWENGIQEPLAVMVSDEAHYCVSRAVKVMGIGEQGVLKIPTDNRLAIRPETLEEVYQKAIQEGRKVIAVVGNACSTSTGTYDDLEAIADFCEKHNLWFHVDAAHGGPALFSEKYKHLVKGMERADSIVIDFHKMMLTPGLTTVVLYKDYSKATNAFSQKADYLLESEYRWYDTANQTIECTRPMLAFRAYVTLKTVGAKGIGDYNTRMFDLGKWFADYLNEQPDFEAVEPFCNIVCYRMKPTSSAMDINIFNSRLRMKMQENARFYIVKTVIHDAMYLRSTIINPMTNESDLKELVEELRKCGNALE